MNKSAVFHDLRRQRDRDGIAGRSHRRFRRFLILLLIGIALPASSSTRTPAQSKSKIFSPVPAEHRARVIHRLNQYIEYRRTRQWGRLYDLYSKIYISERWRPQGMTRREFVSGNKEDDRAGRGNNLSRFVATAVRYVKGEGDVPLKAIVQGCGEYYVTRAGRRTGNSRRAKSVVELAYEAGDWYLTEMVMDYPCEGCEAEKCRMPTPLNRTR